MKKEMKAGKGLNMTRRHGNEVGGRRGPINWPVGLEEPLVGAGVQCCLGDDVVPCEIANSEHSGEVLT